MALEKLLPQLRAGLHVGLITLASALPSNTTEVCKPKNPEQQAQQTYNSFSQEKKAVFDKYFAVDVSKLGNFEISFLQDVYSRLFKKGTFNIRNMTLSQKIKIYEHTQRSDEENKNLWEKY